MWCAALVQTQLDTWLQLNVSLLPGKWQEARNPRDLHLAKLLCALVRTVPENGMVTDRHGMSRLFEAAMVMIECTGVFGQGSRARHDCDVSYDR